MDQETMETKFVSEGDDMEERIIEAARDLINQYGFRKFTMDDVSRNLGISKKTLYKFYSGKKQLISAVNDHLIEIDTEKTIQAMEQEQSWLAKIQSIIFISQYAIPACIVSELRYFYPVEWKKVQALREFKSQQIYTLLREGAKKGEINPALELDIVVPMLEKILESLLQLDYLSSHDLTIRKFLEQVSEILFSGILKRAGSEEE